MSRVAEISEAIEKLDVKEQVELLRILLQHLKISPDDLTWSCLAEPAFEFWNNPEDAIFDRPQVEQDRRFAPSTGGEAHWRFAGAHAGASARSVAAVALAVDRNGAPP